MGIDYNAVVVVGLPQGEMAYNEDEYYNLADFLEDNNMEFFSPYFDGSDADKAICGFEYKKTGSYHPEELEWNDDKINQLKANFKKITGLDARVWLTPQGW